MLADPLMRLVAPQFLDPRIATARYGGFLRASLPPFWETTDREKVHGALRRLRESS